MAEIDKSEQVANVYFKKGSKFPTFLMADGQTKHPHLNFYGGVAWYSDSEYEQMVEGLKTREAERMNRSWFSRLFEF